MTPWHPAGDVRWLAFRVHRGALLAYLRFTGGEIGPVCWSAYAPQDGRPLCVAYLGGAPARPANTNLAPIDGGRERRP